MNIVVAQNLKTPKRNSLDGYDSVEISGQNAPNGGQNYASIQISTSLKRKAPVDPEAGIFGTDLKSALNNLLGSA